MQTATTKERDVDIQIRCVCCGNLNTIYVNQEDYEEYYNSDSPRYIQDVFPYLTIYERELMLSKICPKCWDKLFNDDED